MTPRSQVRTKRAPLSCDRRGAKSRGKSNKALAADGLFEKDPKRFNQLVRLLEKTQAELDEKEQRWLELEMLQEELGAT